MWVWDMVVADLVFWQNSTRRSPLLDFVGQKALTERQTGDFSTRKNLSAPEKFF
jgi:hypothetical protein